jgi:hypothetical protein
MLLISFLLFVLHVAWVASMATPLPVPDAMLNEYLAGLYSKASEALSSAAPPPPLLPAGEPWGALPPADVPTCSVATPTQHAMLMMMGERTRRHLSRVVVVVSLNTPNACMAVPRWWSIMRVVFSQVRFIVPEQYAEEHPCQRIQGIIPYKAPLWNPTWREKELAFAMHLGFLAATRDLLQSSGIDGVILTADDLMLSPWHLLGLNLNRISTYPHGERGPTWRRGFGSLLDSQQNFVTHVFDSSSPPPYAAHLVPSVYRPNTVLISTANMDFFYLPQRLLAGFSSCLEDATAYGVVDFCIAFSTCQKAVEDQKFFQTAVLLPAWEVPQKEVMARVEAMLVERADYLHPYKLGKDEAYKIGLKLWTCMAE